MKNVVSETDKNQICHIFLNRPEKLNAFEPEMVEELIEAFTNVSADSSLRGVVLRGKGKAFCAGADLVYMKSMANFSMEKNLEDSQKLFQMFLAVRQCPVPVLAKVHGSVFGGGLGLLAASDIGYAVLGTQFCFSEVRLGLVPAVISPFVISRMGPSFYRELMFLGTTFDGQLAKESGLIRFQASEEEVEGAIEKFSYQLSQVGPEAVRETKRLINSVESVDWQKWQDECGQVISERRMSVEGQEGLSSFFAKGSPNWKR